MHGQQPEMETDGWRVVTKLLPMVGGREDGREWTERDETKVQ